MQFSLHASLLARLLHYPVGFLILKFGWAYWNPDFRTVAGRRGGAAGNQISGKAARRIAVDPRRKLAVDGFGAFSFLDHDSMHELTMPGDRNCHMRPGGVHARTGIRTMTIENVELPIGAQEFVVPVPPRSGTQGLPVRRGRRAG